MKNIKGHRELVVGKIENRRGKLQCRNKVRTTKSMKTKHIKKLIELNKREEHQDGTE